MPIFFKLSTRFLASSAEKVNMLPNKESYTVAGTVPYFEEVFDYLILYLQTQTNT